MLISIVMPTHNRHLLLKEAIQSVLSQSYREWELIIVDDASSPPVVLDAADLNGSDRVRLLRNPSSLGPSGARNTGIQSASGDLVTFLDDDDLFTSNALELIAQVFHRQENLDCLFINVDPFGDRAEGTRENQVNALLKILGKLGFESGTPKGVLQLPHNLFEILLDAVPIAFQRMAIRKAALARVGNFMGRGFEDIEFYYRIALRCRCGLLMDAVSRLRCGDQGYFSNEGARAILMDTSIRIREGLLLLPEVSNSRDTKQHVRRSLATAHFNRAYLSYVTGKKFTWRHYFSSLSMGVTWPHLSLLLKVLWCR